MNCSLGRVFRLAVLAEIVALIFDTSIKLPLIAEAKAQTVTLAVIPEMPAMVVPVFLLMVSAALFYIRKRTIATISA